MLHLHCKSSPPSFLLYLFFFFFIAVQSFAHHPKSQLRPDAEGQMKQWMHSARWFPHEQGSAGERSELIAETSQEQSFGERINLISTFKEKGGSSLYQFMLQHISVVNLFVENWLKNCICFPLLKTQEKKNQISGTLVCCKSFNTSLWGWMVWSLPQLKWFFVSQAIFWFPKYSSGLFTWKGKANFHELSRGTLCMKWGSVLLQAFLPIVWRIHWG